MIKHYILEENIFVVIVYKLSLLKRHAKDCFKINGKQIINIPKKSKYVKFKKCQKKNKITIYDLSRFGKYSTTKRQ